MTAYSPEIGDKVVIESVAFGSHDVVGMTGVVDSINATTVVVRVKFTATDAVNVPAINVRPA